MYLTGEKEHNLTGDDYFIATQQPKITTPFLKDVKLLKVQENYYYAFLDRVSDDGSPEIMHVGMISTTIREMDYDCRRQIINAHEVVFDRTVERYVDKGVDGEMLPLRVTLGCLHYSSLDHELSHKEPPKNEFGKVIQVSCIRHAFGYNAVYFMIPTVNGQRSEVYFCEEQTSKEVMNTEYHTDRYTKFYWLKGEFKFDNIKMLIRSYPQQNQFELTDYLRNGVMFAKNCSYKLLDSQVHKKTDLKLIMVPSD